MLFYSFVTFHHLKSILKPVTAYKIILEEIVAGMR